MNRQEISRWADGAMFTSEPMPEGAKSGPKVTLLNATPDPLGSLAALCAMYEGRVVRNLTDVTDDQRRQAFEDMTNTALSGPLEVAQFHFLVEGVTRSFTHQMVRERMAFFAQESMRFAVPEGSWVESGRVALPPSLFGTVPLKEIGFEGSDSLAQHQRGTWDNAVDAMAEAYEVLVGSGMPAEDARGLMPHAITTRLHWVLDLRGLLHVAGLRLCTQAQFEWRQVMAGVVAALRSYPSNWQFGLIADHLRPVCYQEGRCGFMAKFDRSCTIRERVNAFARDGIASDKWGSTLNVTSEGRPMLPILNSEWAADPTAARRKD